MSLIQTKLKEGEFLVANIWISMDPFLTITSTASRANGLSISSFGFTEIQTKCSIPNSLALLV